MASKSGKEAVEKSIAVKRYLSLATGAALYLGYRPGQKWMPIPGASIIEYLSSGATHAHADATSRTSISTRPGQVVAL